MEELSICEKLINNEIINNDIPIIKEYRDILSSLNELDDLTKNRNNYDIKKVIKSIELKKGLKDEFVVEILELKKEFLKTNIISEKIINYNTNQRNYAASTKIKELFNYELFSLENFEIKIKSEYKKIVLYINKDKKPYTGIVSFLIKNETMNERVEIEIENGTKEFLKNKYINIDDNLIDLLMLIN